MPVSIGWDKAESSKINLPLNLLFFAFGKDGIELVRNKLLRLFVIPSLLVVTPVLLFGLHPCIVYEFAILCCLDCVLGLLVLVERGATSIILCRCHLFNRLSGVVHILFTHRAQSLPLLRGLKVLRVARIGDIPCRPREVSSSTHCLKVPET